MKGTKRGATAEEKIPERVGESLGLGIGGELGIGMLSGSQIQL